ncbi:MAG: S1 RNA-binding domain-containing protein, partial [Candidatus Bathyarchaeia archaeon]
MSINRDYPEEGDLVIATVKRIESYGAYVTLDEYEDQEGLLHISEIASTWVRNIRDHVREGQKLVLKVLRVDPEKGHIDLSLRRVTGREKTEKLLQWKKDKKAESIMKTAIEKLKKTDEEANAIKEAILKKYESLYDAFEEAVEEGEETFIKLGISSEWAKALTESAKLKINNWLEENNLGYSEINYKLRDWIFSRQHYWGEPIPMILCKRCGWQPVPEKDLPVELPKVKKYKPTDTGESPLASIKKWVNVKCPKCKGDAQRETDTMPNWAGSNWYYLRYTDVKNNKKLADE